MLSVLNVYGGSLMLMVGGAREPTLQYESTTQKWYQSG